MPMVYLRCPETDYLVATGRIIADEYYLAQPRGRRHPINCPFCEQTHVLTATNGCFLSPTYPGEQYGLLCVD